MLVRQLVGERSMRYGRCLTAPLLRHTSASSAGSSSQQFKVLHSSNCHTTELVTQKEESQSTSIRDGQFTTLQQRKQHNECHTQHPNCISKVKDVNFSASNHVYNCDTSLTITEGPGMLGISHLQLTLNKINSRPLYMRSFKFGINKRKSNNISADFSREQLGFGVSEARHLPLCQYNYSIISSNRCFHTNSKLFDTTPSSQVEVTVNALKEKAEAEKKKKEVDKTASLTGEGAKKLDTVSTSPVTATTVAQTDLNKTVTADSVSSDDSTAVVKKTIWVRVKEEILHYYHGFRLLFIDTKICIRSCYRVIQGEKLSRREHRQLVRTTGDLFRLLPFSVFIIIPFMELLLPVALKLFPGMLPSTFETANEKEAKMKKRLKVKLEMAKFLQETLDTIPLQGKGHKSQSAKEFVIFFEKVRRTGEYVSNEDILKFSKLFADKITLDVLTRPQLLAICQLLEMQPFGTNNFLRFQLRMKLRFLVADDKLIANEGVESLSPWELQLACRSRGMRAYGMTNDRLRQQLRQWLELSLDKKVPQSLLLLSRTLYLSDHVDETAATLVETIKQLPDEVKTRTKAAIGKREGKIDNRTRLEVIQTEEKRILEDKKDIEDEKTKKIMEEAKKKVEVRHRDFVEELGIGEAEVVSVSAPSQAPTVEATVAAAVKLTKATVTDEGRLEEEFVDKAPTLVDTAQVLTTDTAKEEELSSQDLAEVEEALETIGAKQRRMIIEEQDLTELKEEMQDYEQDIEEFKNMIAEVPERQDLRESKAARRLFSRINRLISQAEPVITALNKKTEEIKKKVVAGEADDKHKDNLVQLEDLVTHLRQVADAPDSAKLAVIRDTLTAMDTDNDGAIKLDHILKAVDLLSEDKVGVSRAMFEEVIQAMSKEEQLQTMTVVQRAMVPPTSEDTPDAVNDKAADGTSAASDVAKTNP